MSHHNVLQLSEAGELIVTLRNGYNTQFKIASWSDGLHFFTYDDELEDWVCEDIDAGLFLAIDEAASDPDSGQPCAAVASFVDAIPQHLRQVVAVFSHKQFSLLRLVAQYPSLSDILIDAPNLCWLVVCRAEQVGWSIAQIAALLQLKRTRIVDALFANTSAQLVKLINKIELINGSEGEALLLLKQLRKVQVVNAFNHWPRVSITVLRIVQQRPFFINSKLLANEIDLSKSKQNNVMRFYEISQTYDDLHRLHNALDKTFTVQVWQAIESVEQLTRLHDKWVARYNRSERGRLARLQEAQAAQARRAAALGHAIDGEIRVTESCVEEVLPLCSIGDLEGFVQIKTRTELAEEGIYMNHCVGSYGAKVASGESYIYKLLKPQRATVEVKVRADKISVTQFKLASNHKPSSESYAYLRALMTSDETS